jgi:hypothetical protein
MKTIKLIDTWGSILLITGFTIWSLIAQDETFFIGYFVVGGWQLLSMIVHSMAGWFMQKGGHRRIYENIVIIILTLTVLGFIVHPILWVLAVTMLFAAPVMAIIYTCICYEEVYIKMKRPLTLLK